MVVTRAGRLREWAVVSDHAKANVQVTHPQRLKTSLIQMITNNTMFPKCVAQQVVAYESLKTKEMTSW